MQLEYVLKERGMSNRYFLISSTWIYEKLCEFVHKFQNQNVIVAALFRTTYPDICEQSQKQQSVRFYEKFMLRYYRNCQYFNHLKETCKLICTHFKICCTVYAILRRWWYIQNVIQPPSESACTSNILIMKQHGDG